MTIGPPTPTYEARDQAAFREAVRVADAGNQKRNQDYRLEDGVRLVLVDDDDGSLWRVKVASGVLSIEAFTG